MTSRPSSSPPPSHTTSAPAPREAGEPGRLAVVASAPAAGDVDLRPLLTAAERAEVRLLVRRALASLAAAAVAVAAFMSGLLLPVPLPAAAVAAGLGLALTRTLAPDRSWACVRGDWVVVAGLRGCRGVRLSRLDPVRVTVAAGSPHLRVADREGRRPVLVRPKGEVVIAVAEALPPGHPFARQVLRAPGCAA